MIKECYTCRHHLDGELCATCCSIGFMQQARVPLWEPAETKKTAPEGAAQAKTSQVDHTTQKESEQGETQTP